MRIKKVNLFFLLVILFCWSCSDNDAKLKTALQGTWLPVIDSSEIEGIPLLNDIPWGRSFIGDSMEFLPGYYDTCSDPNTQRIMYKYLGNFTPYKIDSGNVYIKNIKNLEWDALFKIIETSKDTIIVKSPDNNTLYKLYRLNYDVGTDDFDQIIYSNSGCYGNCPIMDISIDKDGNILFIGEGYVPSLGFFEGKTDEKQVKFIFDKFRKADPCTLSDKYLGDGTDQATLTTTFIKNGKIVKTIEDYGFASPKELKWAYKPIAGLHDIIDLKQIPHDEPFYPVLHYMAFEKEGTILQLLKSEGFYLWTELKKSKIVETEFTPKYKIIFLDNLDYIGPIPNKNRRHNYTIHRILTDGQYFRYEFKDRSPIIYDLGYNFIDKNLDINRFRKPINDSIFF